jgi:hypothetical protein
MKGVQYILLLVSILITNSVFPQTQKKDTVNAIAISTDSTSAIKIKDTTKARKDTVVKHNPRKATLRSALIPGWGQAYNKEYWKIPLVYAVVGIPAGFFVYNNTWYKRSKKAYDIVVSNDSAGLPSIHPKLQGLNAQSLQFYRNQFRRDRDYSILYTLIAWGLNVADATVFAHLKDFDVSDDLTFKVEPGYSPLAKTSGLSFVLAVK